MALTVRATAPTRVDLLGGTLDLWPFYAVLEEKATINLGVSVLSQALVTENPNKRYTIISKDQKVQTAGDFSQVTGDRQLPLPGLLLREFWSEEWPGLHMTLEAESPQGAGLGGSSSLALTIASALTRMRELLFRIPAPEESQLITAVANSEARLLHTPTGTQDHWGAMRGGLNLISYPITGPSVETISPASFLQSGFAMILCYCGRSRLSGLNNWEIFQKFFNRDPATVEALKQLGVVSARAMEPARLGQWERVLTYSQEEWQIRRRMCPGVETEETRFLAEISLKNGAWFSRVCGAGGGGVMAIFAPESHQEEITWALAKAGGQILKKGPVRQGLNVSEDWRSDRGTETNFLPETGKFPII